MPFGAISAPTITPLRAPSANRPSNHIDTGTYVELETQSPNCKIYFTTDGSKPNPFAQRFAGRDITFKYRAPFSLKTGKRTVKALAVAANGVQESPIVSRTFIVDDLNPTTKPTHYYTETPVRDTLSSESDSDSSSERPKKGKAKREPSPFYEPRRKAWDEPPKSDEKAFQPTNHSGTQINLYGGAPPGMPFGMPMAWEVKKGDLSYGSMPSMPYGQLNPYESMMAGNMLRQSMPSQDSLTKEQLGLLANTLLQKMDQEHKMTVAEVKAALKETETKALQHKPAPAPEPRPADFDPPLQPIAQGAGDLKKQLQHVYAHMLDYARSDPDFRAAIGSAPLGPLANATLDDNGDCFQVSLKFDKPPGMKKAPKVEKPKPKPKKEPEEEEPKPAKKEGPPPGASTRPLSRSATPSLAKMEKPEEEVKISSAKIAEGDKKAQAAPELALKTEAQAKPPEKVESSYFETEEYVQDGTLKPVAEFNVDDDCKRLMKSTKGLGTDEATIGEILSHRSLKQRLAIKDRYKAMYGKELIEEIDGELKPSAEFKKTCRALLQQPYEFDASQLNEAIKGLGTDEETLIEIICTRTNDQMKQIKETYNTLFKKSLEKDVEDDTSGDFKRLLVSFMQGTRPEGQQFDRAQAKKDAQELYDAGVGKRFGTDESKFREVLGTRSNAHLRAMFNEYEKLNHGKSLEDTIKDEMSGDFKDSVLAVVRCIRHKPAYFAHVLNKSFGGILSHSNTVIRVIVSRCEVDMVQIKEAFQAEANKPLGEAVANYNKGHFGKMLLSLCADDSYAKKK